MLKWTSEPPQEPGWYWMQVPRQEDTPWCVQVTQTADGVYVAWIAGIVRQDVKFLVSIGYKFAGPIPEPTGAEHD